MKRPAVLLAAVLLLLPVGLITYRILGMGYPALPTAAEKVWQLSIDAHLQGSDQETVLSVGMPERHGEVLVIEEKIQSGSMSFNLVREGLNQVGLWSGVVGPQEEAIGYQATIQLGVKKPPKAKAPGLDPYPEGVKNEEKFLTDRLAVHWNKLEPRPRLRALVAALQGDWGHPAPREQDLEAWSLLQQRLGSKTAFLVLLRAANLPARIAEGLPLVESVTSTPTVWFEVWTGEEWESLLPGAGVIHSKPVPLLPLARGIPAVRISQGELSEIRWILSRQTVSQWRLHFERIKRSNRFLDRWSLFHLPNEFQGIFRILLLVPIGALLISILRNVAGFPTFGVFMPVLMALAFRSTGLAYGLGVFGGVVLIGFLVRRGIDRLHLLLVPRLSVLLTLVIVCITVFALIGNKLGVREFMAIGLLPFVILTMTIERFFVMAEEAGVRKALWTAAGTAAVATITHEILHLNFLQLTFFLYPELLFAVAAAQILLGRYTGYRLSELLRFRILRRSP